MGVVKSRAMGDSYDMRRRTTSLRGQISSRGLARLGDESGIALVMALGIVLVLTIVLTAVITFTASGARDAKRVNAGQKAFALAEAGINNALAVLNANYPADGTAFPYPGPRCLLGQKAAPTGFPGKEPIGSYTCDASVPQEFVSTPDSTRPNETTTWWGRIRVVPGLGFAWVISATGSVQNPTGPNASAVSRTIYAKVPIVQDDAQDVDPGVLNFVYSVNDAIIGQGVDLRSPLYVRGNLTLENTAEVHAPIYVTCVEPPAAVPTATSPCPNSAGNVWMGGQAEVFETTHDLADVAVGGRLEQTTNNNHVGRSGSRLSMAHVINGCKKKSNPWHTPCQWDEDNVFVDQTGATGVPTIPKSPGTNRNTTMPSDPVPVPPDSSGFANYYTTAQPGPAIPCDNGTYPPLEQGDEVLSVSVPGKINLTPAFSYECKTNGDDGGEISWDYDAKILTVRGTIFIDGSVEIAETYPGQPGLLYEGQGVIYVAGTFGLKNTTICAVLSGDDCNIATDAWDPNTNALIIIAMSKGEDLPVSQQTAAGENSVEVVSSQFQGALFGVYDVSSTTTSVVQGPLISTDASIIIRNTTGASFPDIYFAPGNTPGTPPPPSLLLAPREFGGGG